MPSIINASTSAGGGVITTADASGQLELQTAGTTAVTIDTSQNVGIGNTVASIISAANGIGQLTVGTGSANSGLTIYTGSTNTGGIAFADGTTTTTTYEGYLNYAHGDNSMRFGTAATERMRITADGLLQFDSGYGSVATAYGCRAWVNFNGTTNTDLSGTYSQTGTTVTVTATAHGLTTGNLVYLDITTGTAVDGVYTVTVTGVNTFTVTQASRTTSGNVTLIRSTIRASANVSSVADNATGDYTVNFITPMPDANYAIAGAGHRVAGSYSTYINTDSGTVQTASACRIYSTNDTGALINSAYVTLAVFR